MAEKQPIASAVDAFERQLELNAAQNADAKAAWLSIEASASQARRAYMKTALGDDNFARVATLVRKGAPIFMKYFGTGGAGAAITSMLANSDSTTGIIGMLKGLLVLPGIGG